MKNVFKLPLVLEPQPEGGYTITCPLAPGLVTEADTLDDVMPNVADAVAALIEAYQDLNKPLPDGLRFDAVRLAHSPFAIRVNQQTRALQMAHLRAHYKPMAIIHSEVTCVRPSVHPHVLSWLGDHGLLLGHSRNSYSHQALTSSPHSTQA